MRYIGVGPYFLSALVLATPTSADIKKPCPAGQSEVVAKGGEILCVATYATRAEGK
jgi:hypothetical protein